MDKLIQQLNEWGKARKPFFFIIDFEKKKPIAHLLAHMDETAYSFDFSNNAAPINEPINLKKNVINFETFTASFDKVKKEINYGNSFLCNLTFSTPITLNTTIENIFKATKAKYKVMAQNDWVCFSPETFIQIKNDKIFTYPMKGTIDANLPNAAAQIINDEKETAEHYTIVDLLRNDLALVSKNVRVNKFRYIDELITTNKTLLQVSSEICGDLSSNWHEQIGSILDKILPAGSISGAPKKKTLEIISNTEMHPAGRQYYTGVAGIYDGETLDSCVLIRYIYQHKNNHYYCSGGGITCNSIAALEYQEYQDKIYLPI